MGNNDVVVNDNDDDVDDDIIDNGVDDCVDNTYDDTINAIRTKPLFQQTTSTMTQQSHRMTPSDICAG